MKIIIAYDGSEYSNAAIDDLRLAGMPESAEAFVLSVADVVLPPAGNDDNEAPLPPSVVAVITKAKRRAESALANAKSLAESAKGRLRDLFPRWTVNAEAFADSPAWAVIRKADEWQPDLVVVGAKGHSVLGGRLILGSVSQRVLYEAGCSVRIGRHRARSSDAPIRIVVGVDGSANSAVAVSAVARRAWPEGTEVRLLAVMDSVIAVTATDDNSTSAKWIEVEDEDNWGEVRTLFQPSVEELQASGLEAAVTIRKGDPANEILEEAESWGADSVFLGAKGIRGIERVLLGSVSSAVAARAHCSVEVVRPPTTETP